VTATPRRGSPRRGSPFCSLNSIPGVRYRSQSVPVLVPICGSMDMPTHPQPFTILPFVRCGRCTKRNGASAANRCTDADRRRFRARKRRFSAPSWVVARPERQQPLENRGFRGVFDGHGSGARETPPPVSRLRLPWSLPVFVVGRLSGRWPARCCASRQTSPCRRGRQRWPLQRAAAASREGSRSSGRER
jgi:hypothetical protein